MGGALRRRRFLSGHAARMALRSAPRYAIAAASPALQRVGSVALVIGTGHARAAGPWVAVALGLSAHAAAAGCLPALLPTLLVLPVALLAVRASDRRLRRYGLLVRAAAGQAVVHAALTVASSCRSHPGADAQGHVLPSLDVVMTGAHVAALILCVTVAARLERSISSLLTDVACWVRATAAQPVALRISPESRRAPVSQRAGFVPTQAVHGSCGITRGPPALRRRPATA